ncbi:MAG: hypothetical protein AAFS08_18475 [Pseudomonadota bacterium]
MKLVWLMIPLTLGACGAIEPKPTVTPVDEETIVTSTASTSNTLILARNTDFVTCTAPAPDATYAQAEAARGTASGARNSESGGFSEASSANGLQGRSPAVLMTRELFFRTCEFSRNYNLTQQQAYELYLKTMQVAATGWDTEAARTTVSIGESQTADITNQTLLVPEASSTADKGPDDGF